MADISRLDAMRLLLDPPPVGRLRAFWRGLVAAFFGA